LKLLNKIYENISKYGKTEFLNPKVTEDSSFGADLELEVRILIRQKVSQECERLSGKIMGFQV
jgi:hypothetical protein